MWQGFFQLTNMQKNDIEEVKPGLENGKSSEWK